jgi:hypothetical protein
MKAFEIPKACQDELKRNNDTGFGYQVIAIELKSGKRYDQVLASQCCIIEVRGHREIPFAPEEIATVEVNHKRWNFRERSDVRARAKAAAA